MRGNGSVDLAVLGSNASNIHIGLCATLCDFGGEDMGQQLRSHGAGPFLIWWYSNCITWLSQVRSGSLNVSLGSRKLLTGDQPKWDAHIHKHKVRYTHTQTSTHAHKHVLTHTNTHAHASTLARTLTLKLTHMHANTHTHRLHIHIHIPNGTHKCTIAYTHCLPIVFHEKRRGKKKAMKHSPHQEIIKEERHLEYPGNLKACLQKWQNHNHEVPTLPRLWQPDSHAFWLQTRDHAQHGNWKAQYC